MTNDELDQLGQDHVLRRKTLQCINGDQQNIQQRNVSCIGTIDESEENNHVNHQVNEVETKRKSIVSHQSSTALNNTKIAVFFLTAPHEEQNRGDTDYLKSVIKGIESIPLLHNVESTSLVYINGQSQHEGEELYSAAVLYQKGKANKQKYQEADDEYRKLAVSRIESCIKTQIKNFKSKYISSSVLTVLHLQLRAPETGCMIHPEDITGLKEIVDKFVITCHEWKHNESSVGARKNQIQQLKYMRYADHTIFLNRADLDDAIQATSNGRLTKGNETETCEKIDDFENNASISSVSATLPTTRDFQSDTDVLLRKSPNILIFGLMRKDKGFEEGIELAKYIKEKEIKIKEEAIRICFAGSPHDLSIAREIIASKWNIDKKILSPASAEQMLYIAEYKKGEAINRLGELLGNSGINDANSVIKTIMDEANTITEGGNEIARKYASKKEEIKRIIREINDAPTPDSYREAKQKTFLIRKYEEMKTYPEYRYVDIEFNVDAIKLDELSARHKYCYKVEKKGFANNSSSIINVLHRRLITFSNSGTMTSAEFLSGGCYNNAIIFSENPKPESVVSEILNRERDPTQEKNRETLNALHNVVTGLFNERKIGQDYWQVYTKLQQQNNGMHK